MSEDERKEAYFKMDCATNELRNKELEHSMVIRQEQHEGWLAHKATVEACLNKSETLSFRDQAAIAAMEYVDMRQPNASQRCFDIAEQMNAERLKRGDK